MEREDNIEAVKTLEARLQYCKEANGLSSCKNCGLCEADIEAVKQYAQKEVERERERIIQFVDKETQDAGLDEGWYGAMFAVKRYLQGLNQKRR